MESAEVNKMDLLRTVDGTVIYEDSNSQPQNQVRIQLYFFPRSSIFLIYQLKNWINFKK